MRKRYAVTPIEPGRSGAARSVADRGRSRYTSAVSNKLIPASIAVSITSQLLDSSDV
jgi:hypothetical protein